LNLTQTEFSGNEAQTGSGGGLYGYQVTFTTVQTKWIDNHAGTQANSGVMANPITGGAISFEAVTSMMNYTSFSHNSVHSGSPALQPAYGGAVYAIHGTNIYWSVQAQQNSASSAGGGFFFYDCTSINYYAEVVNNTAGEGGGYVIDDATFIVYNASVQYNVATAGQGGALLSNDSSLIIYNATMESNVAMTNGGAAAVYLDTSTLVSTNVSYVNNISGGGARLDIVCLDSSTNLYDTPPEAFPVVDCQHQCDVMVVYDGHQKQLCSQAEPPSKEPHFKSKIV